MIIAVSILDHTVASSAAMPLTSGIMSIFIIAEVASLLENVRRLGVKTPKIKAILDAYVAGNEQTPLGPVKKKRKDQDG